MYTLTTLKHTGSVNSGLKEDAIQKEDIGQWKKYYSCPIFVKHHCPNSSL